MAFQNPTTEMTSGADPSPPVSSQIFPNALKHSQSVTEAKTIKTLLTIFECGGMALVGCGAALVVIGFIYTTGMAELGTFLAGAAAPFTMGGFMFIAATNYQQQRQLTLLQAQTEQMQHQNSAAAEQLQLMRTEQSKAEARQVQEENRQRDKLHEEHCLRSLNAYRLLRDTTDLLTRNVEIQDGINLKGAVGFKLLRDRIANAAITEPKQQGVPNWQIYQERLEPFIGLLREYILSADQIKDPEIKGHLRTQLASSLTMAEREVISQLQNAQPPHADGKKCNLTTWLANNA